MEDLYVRQAVVERVVDGDTLDLMVDLGFGVWTKQRIRLARIDTPEVRGDEREAGLAAKAFVERILMVGEIDFITVKTTKKTGKYGRYIGEIEFRMDDKTINLSDILLAEGYAEKYE